MILLRKFYKVGQILLLITNMKIKVSVSMEENTIKEVEQKVKNGIFRNKSHFIELATQKMLTEKRK